MRLEELLKGVSILQLQGPGNQDVAGISSDSREVRPGMLFTAIRGLHEDGHRYIEDAIRRGASVLVTEEDAPVKDLRDVSVVRVASAPKAIAQLAANYYGRPAERLHLLGITGTNGKTTLSYLIRSLLTVSGRKSGLIGTIAYCTGGDEVPAPFTTPEPILLHRVLNQMVEEGCSFAVLEVSSHALSLDRVSGLSFETAVFTNLTRDHLDFHPDMESYYQAKASLFRSPMLKNRAVICGDDTYGKRLIEEMSLPVWSYGLEASWDIRAEGLSLTRDGIYFEAVTPLGKFPVQSKLIGRYNVVNILGAIGAGLSLGLTTEEIVEGIRRMVRVPGRLERIDEGQDFTVVVDYAHTEDALLRLLQSLEVESYGQVITVFGCGGERDRGKRPRMGKVAALWSDVILLTSDNPRGEDPGGILSEIEAGVREVMDKDVGRARSCLIVPDRREAIRDAVQRAGRWDLVVIAGKGHETYQIIGAHRVSLDDRELARTAIREKLQSDVNRKRDVYG